MAGTVTLTQPVQTGMDIERVDVFTGCTAVDLVSDPMTWTWSGQNFSFTQWTGSAGYTAVES